MKFVIEPYVGVKNINFGMSRNIVRNYFNNQFKEFKKNLNSQNTTDNFGCCHVYYTVKNTCEAIEFFDGVEIYLNGYSLIGKPYNEVKSFFEIIDNFIDINDAGFISYKYGVGIFAPFALDAPEEPVESVIVFENGYYD